MQRVAIIGLKKIEGVVAKFLEKREVETCVYPEALLFSGNVGEEIDKDALIVVGLWGEEGYEVLLNLVEKGLNVISLFPYPIGLERINRAAMENEVVVILIPAASWGLAHMLAGSAKAMLGGIDELRMYLGNITAEFNPYFGVADGWNIQEYMEMYRRPAKFILNSSRVLLDPLESYVGRINIEGVGELEYFPVDALTPIFESFPNLRFAESYALGWPGHWEFMRGLKRIGLLAENLHGNEEADACLMALVGKKGMGVKDMHILLLEAFRGRKGVKFLHVVKPREAERAFEWVIGIFIASVAWKFLEGKIPQRGILFPQELGLREEISVPILENFALNGMPVREEFITRKKEVM